MSIVRLRRLQSDYQRLVAFVRRQPRLRLIQTEGEPPEKYQLEFHVRGLRQVGEELKIVDRHLVEIALPRNYPRTPPQCRMLTPVFHPNIAPHAICIGDHWSAGEPLWAMVARIGEMIALQSYNVKSPLNGEAARWVEENEDRLPLDPAPIYVEESEAPAAAADTVPVARVVRGVPVQPARPAPSPPAQTRAGQPVPPAARASTGGQKISVQCPRCGARYRVPAETAGKKAQCKQCQTVISIPASRPPLR